MMHLSEVIFESDGEGCKVAATDEARMHFATFARLCGLSTELLERVLTVREIKTKVYMFICTCMHYIYV
jgi:hypothetical protein